MIDSNFFADLEVNKYKQTEWNGKSLMDNEGQVFHMHKKEKVGTKIYWRCGKYKRNRCPARAITKGVDVIGWTGIHNH